MLVAHAVARFEFADGGTLFLDEIGNLPLSGQMKLLRVLESGQFEPLGSSRTRTTRVRVLSATNAELPQMIRQGLFREDLYYRLNTIEIPLPALAARPADILPLAQHFLGPKLTLSDDARQALLQHGWPGNVRELRNVLERARLLASGGEVQVVDLNLPVPKGQGTVEEAGLNRGAIEASLRAATLALEDRRFWDHPGVDPAAVLRAAFNNMRGKRRSGASTLAMQVARMQHPAPRSLDLVFDLKDLQGADPALDQRLRGSDNLWVNRFPYAVALVSQMRSTGTGTFEADAAIALRDTS